MIANLIHQLALILKKKINENEKIIKKNINNNIFDKYIKKTEKSNDNKFLNSSKKKNNIFFTINKTIIHNMNNTFNNSNHNKHCITNINNITEELNNEEQFSLTKSPKDNNNSKFGINLKKKLITKCKLANNYIMKNNKIPALKTDLNNINDRIDKKMENKRKMIINKSIF